MKFVSKTALPILLLLASLAAQAYATSPLFVPYQHFPRPAPGAFVVSGAGLPDGRLLVWDGSTVYRQFSDGTDKFEAIAHGYAGDTGFVALAPDGHTALLGQGFNGNLYLLDSAAPADYTVSAIAAQVPGHFAGAYLNDHLVLLDVGRLDFSGSELQVIDLDTAKAGAKALPQTVIAKGAGYHRPAGKSLVVDKPPFAYSSAIAVDPANGLAYAMDSNTRELRAFAVADLIDAYTNATPLDWATDGTLLGTLGAFYSGGVSGIRPDGNLVIGGSAGYLLPGGIQVVNPSLAHPAAASVLETYDPTGNQDYYYVIYNPSTDAITGITFDGAAYAPQDAVVPVPVLSGPGLALLGGAFAAATARVMHKRPFGLRQSEKGASGR